MRTKMIMFCFALMSGTAVAQDSTVHHMDKTMNHDMKNMDGEMPMFKDAKLGNAYAHYIHVKDALVASNSIEAKKMASELKTALASVSNGNKASVQAAKIANTSTLADQRKAFESLSAEMTALVKGGQLSMGMIYVEYCPMVKASWLSNEKEIKNPYYGDQMMKCGNVKEMIE